MIYKDRVYGEVEITEPVILELINSPSLQRLTGVDQAGYSKPYFPGIIHNRYEHSLGVYIILKKYKAPLAEQIAGLIHDISHSAFSHCIDYALDEGSETEHSHQDNVFDNYVKKSEIPGILKKYGFETGFILDDKNFPLKEKNLPDLCADRIDYSLRTGVAAKLISQSDTQEILNNLIVESKKWIFKNFDFAKKYAELFLKINIDYYSGLTSAVMFRTVGDYLRYAMQKSYINEKELYSTDNEVISKISVFLKEDNHLQLLFDRMNNKVGYRNDPGEYDAKVSCKSRVVDPLFKNGPEIKRLSDIDSGWKKILALESTPKVYFIKFER
jgi:HD superfamily phosphohydrolase